LYRVAPWPVGHSGADDFALCARLSPDLAGLRLVDPCIERIARDFSGRLHLFESVMVAIVFLWLVWEVRLALCGCCRDACKRRRLSSKRR
jgi:hypothetical protein